VIQNTQTMSLWAFSPQTEKQTMAQPKGYVDPE
jgi:hypothetical protein